MNSDNHTRAALEASRSMRDAAAGMVPAFASLAVALERFGRSLYTLAWHSYIMAGAPYGETREGLNRWVNERQALNT